MTKTTIIFDLGGVIVWTDWERVTVPLSQIVGVSPEAVMERLVTGDAYKPFMRGEFDANEFCRRFALQFQLDWSCSRIAALWAEVIQPHREITSLVESLRGNYRLVVGSNTDALHYQAGLEVQPVLSTFEPGILSYEVACLKPDVKFFERGLARLSLAPGECVFTDDRAENVEAARSVGIDAFQFTSVDQLMTDLTSLGIRF